MVKTCKTTRSKSLNATVRRCTADQRYSVLLANDLGRFSTFNAWVIRSFTLDRYPKRINGVEDRLKSASGWGRLAIRPPGWKPAWRPDEKADDIRLPGEVILIAERLRSNVRELEAR